MAKKIEIPELKSQAPRHNDESPFGTSEKTLRERGIEMERDGNTYRFYDNQSNILIAEAILDENTTIIKELDGLAEPIHNGIAGYLLSQTKALTVHKDETYTVYKSVEGRLFVLRTDHGRHGSYIPFTKLPKHIRKKISAEEL